MATQKTLPTAISPDNFLNLVSDENIRADCKEIVAMMRDATKEEPTMWGPAIIGFGQYHYKYESGHEGDICVIGFSPRKQNLTFYVSVGLEQLQPLLEKLGKYKTGKSCLYIKKLADVDRAVLKKIFSTSYQALKYHS